jgi:lysophospholipase L1-like esterase
MFLLSGLGFLLLALVYNEFLIARLDPNPPLERDTVAGIRRVEVGYLLAALAFLGLAGLASPRRRVGLPYRFFNHDTVQKITIAALVLVLPLFVAETSLRPLVRLWPKQTTVFVKDEDLGWRLRPNTVDEWKGITVRINGKGLRGPELAYEKPAGKTRILYLGDSVTFGFGLQDYAQSFPYAVEPMLEKVFGTDVETINAGVGGYSPWQELVYLRKEGIRYAPDLVVVGFVLNDVSEKIGLVRVGGKGEGTQLASSYYSFFDWLRHNSAAVHVAHRLLVRRRFGADTGEGAKERESRSVRRLIDDPRSPDFGNAWEITLENLSGIFDFCREREVPVLLLAFPFTYQLEDVERRSGPQEILLRHAGVHGLPVIDLLPVLKEKITEQKKSPTDFFLDDDHLTSHGSAVVAAIIADFIETNSALLLPHLTARPITE